jgi:hypothetical protein
MRGYITPTANGTIILVELRLEWSEQLFGMLWLAMGMLFAFVVTLSVAAAIFIGKPPTVSGETASAWASIPIAVLIALFPNAVGISMLRGGFKPALQALADFLNAEIVTDVEVVEPAT